MGPVWSEINCISQFPNLFGWFLTIFCSIGVSYCLFVIKIRFRFVPKGQPSWDKGLRSPCNTYWEVPGLSPTVSLIIKPLLSPGFGPWYVPSNIGERNSDFLVLKKIRFSFLFLD